MTAAPVALRGGCLCGAVRYELRGRPLVMYHCHCGACRKASGASHVTNLVVRVADFAVVEGADVLARYLSSPDKHRHFCARCGSPIYSHGQQTAQIVSIRSGTLDGDPGIRPSVHVYVASRAPWVELTDDLPQRPEGIG